MSNSSWYSASLKKIACQSGSNLDCLNRKVRMPSEHRLSVPNKQNKRQQDCPYGLKTKPTIKRLASPVPVKRTPQRTVACLPQICLSRLGNKAKWPPMQKSTRHTIAAKVTRLFSVNLIVRASKICKTKRQPYTFLKLRRSKAPDHTNLAALNRAEMELTSVKN